MFNRKIKKVMMVFPRGKILKGHFHYCQVPMGVAYLAAALRGDFAVEVLDGRAKFRTIIPRDGQWEYFGYTQQEMAGLILASGAEIVGISCLFSHQAVDVLELCGLLKKQDPRIITVIGGAHPSFIPERIMREYSQVDFIVLGEGEQTLSRLVRSIDAGLDYRQLDGLAFRENGGFRINPKTEFIRDLDSLAFPAYDLLPLEFYEKKAVPFSVTFRSR
ncbi:MAG: cobalamin B12-binding domain-containing protein, partial [Candidatus Omnitrophica bacterium]|nr:cobalamin B12-binding domain-containing protein [Candidatus Omnitrophota bacterium]